MASLDRQPAQPHDGIDPAKQQKRLDAVKRTDLPQQAWNIKHTLIGYTAETTNATAKPTTAPKQNVNNGPVLDPPILISGETLGNLANGLQEFNRAIASVKDISVYEVPTHLVGDLEDGSISKEIALAKINQLRKRIQGANLLMGARHPQAADKALKSLTELEQLIAAQKVESNDKDLFRTRSIVTQNEWNSIVQEFAMQHPHNGQFDNRTFRQNIDAILTLFPNAAIRTITDTIINEKIPLSQKKLQAGTLRDQLQQLMIAANKGILNKAQQAFLEKKANSYMLATVHIALNTVLVQLANLDNTGETAAPDSGKSDSVILHEDAKTETQQVIVTPNSQPERSQTDTEPQNTTAQNEEKPKRFGDTLRSWGKSIKEFISPSTVTGKHVQKRQSTTGWLAVGLAGLMSYFGNKQADTPTSHVAPTTIEAVGPQKNVETVTAVVAEGSVHAGLDAQHRKNASVQRGLENALDQVNGRQILASLYPGEVITSAEHTYLSDTISDRIQKALPNGFHTHNNNETIAVSHTGSTKAGLETFVVTMTSSEAHRSHTATVNIAIPSSTTVHRQAVHHVAALRHQNNSQPQPATTAATDASLPPAALARQNARLTQELTGGSNIVSDMTVATPRNPQLDVPNTAAMPPLDSRGTNLPQFPAQTDRVEAVQTAPEQNLNLSETARIVSTLNLFANNEPTNPAQFRFNTESGSNGSAISLTVISGDNELVVPFNGLQFQNGTVTCTVGGSRMPLTVAIENALRTHTNQARVLSGAAARAIVDVMSHRQPLSSHNTIINSGPDLVHAELAKLAASDAEKDRIPNKIAAMQRAARERLDAYYATREREAQARKQMRAQIINQL